jgi:hypothetical protein
MVVMMVVMRVAWMVVAKVVAKAVAMAEQLGDLKAVKSVACWGGRKGSCLVELMVWPQAESKV